MFFSKTLMPEGIQHYKTHKFLHAFFPETGKREFVYRQDGSRVMLLSGVKPAMENSRSLVEKGVYTFAVRCVPNMNVDKKLTYIMKASERREWLAHQLAKIGAELRYGEVADSRRVEFHTDSGNRVWFQQADMRGVLAVNDPVAFTNGLLRGIGRARAWGCGLIYLPEVMR